jgi:hypothetical protein
MIASRRRGCVVKLTPERDRRRERRERTGRAVRPSLAVDAIASGVGEGLPPVRDLFNKPTLFE